MTTEGSGAMEHEVELLPEWVDSFFEFFDGHNKPYIIIRVRG